MDMFLITNGLAKADNLTHKVHKLVIFSDESGYIFKGNDFTHNDFLFNRVVIFNNCNELIHKLAEYIHYLEDSNSK